MARWLALGFLKHQQYPPEKCWFGRRVSCLLKWFHSSGGGKVGVILMEENLIDQLRLIVLTYELVRDACSIDSSLL